MFRIDYHCGHCPFEAEGVVCDSLPFYFRSRGRHWTFDVAHYPGDDAVSGSLLCIQGDFSDAEYTAGWIEHEQAVAMVEICAHMAERLLPSRCAEALATGFVSLHSRRPPCAHCGKPYADHVHEIDRTAPPTACLGLRVGYVTEAEREIMKNGNLVDLVKYKAHGAS